MLWSGVMKTATLLRLIVAPALVVWAGCASAPPAGAPAPKKTSVERNSDGKPYDFRSEGTIPPLNPGDAANEPDVEETSVAAESLDVSDAPAPEPVAPPTAAPAASATQVDGFRVQVFATADREIAENASRSAQGRLNLATYVELDGGMYKVRVGDFETRAAADQALTAIRREYADAWVVPSKVKAARTP